MANLNFPFELFISELPICAWVMDRSLKVTHSAGKALKNPGKPIWESPTLIQALQQALDGTEVSFSMDWEGFAYEISLKTFDTGVAGYALDITDSKLLETQRIQTQPIISLGRIVGGIAHDFNNLLTVILNYAELLESDLNGIPDAKPKLEAIANSAERAVSLTSQLLISARAQKFKEIPMQLNMLVNSAVHLLKKIIGEDIELNVQLDPASNMIQADPNQLLNAILTLVDKSKQSMPNGGRLSIQTLSHGDRILLVLQDTGNGFDEKALASEPEFAAAASIIKSLKGEIETNSKPDSGTKFTISFTSQAPAKLTEPQKITSLEAGPQTVLVVEDEEIVRQVACDIIRSGGYNVVEATNAMDALELCDKSENIDLVLTDLIMPKMNGPEFIKKLSLKFPKIGVVFMSGYNSDAVFGKGLLEENTAFIQKPFMPKALLKVVKDTLDTSKVS